MDIRKDGSVRHSGKKLTVSFALYVFYLGPNRVALLCKLGIYMKSEAKSKKRLTFCFSARNIDSPDLPLLSIESRPSNRYPEQVMRP